MEWREQEGVASAELVKQAGARRLRGKFLSLGAIVTVGRRFRQEAQGHGDIGGRKEKKMGGATKKTGDEIIPKNRCSYS